MVITYAYSIINLNKIRSPDTIHFFYPYLTIININKTLSDVTLVMASN